MIEKTRVLLVGYGCREAVLAMSIARQEAEIFCVVKFKNPLIEQLAKDLQVVDHYTPKTIAQYATSVKPQLLMIGPEDPIEVFKQFSNCSTEKMLHSPKISCIKLN